MKKKKIAASLLLSAIVLGAVSGQALAAGSKGSVDFEYSKNLDPKPFDPTDPNVPPAEIFEELDGHGKGSTGLLRFDRVPNFKFSTIEIGSVNQTGNVIQEKYKDKLTSVEYFAAPTVEITDNRGSGAGWSTFVSVEEDLVNLDDVMAPVIKGFELKLNNAFSSGYSGIADEINKHPDFTPITVGNVATKFAKADSKKGMASWGISFYVTPEANGKPAKNSTNTPTESSAVTLKIPQGATMNVGETYMTSLTWYMAVTPDAIAP